MSLRILFVEDHDDTRRIMSGLLQRFGHDVYPAANCREALRLLDESQFHVLLCDIGLPDGNGFDVIRKAKQSHDLTGIAFTAYNSRRDFDEATKAGFDHYLLKPCDLAELRGILSQIVA